MMLPFGVLALPAALCVPGPSAVPAPPVGVPAIERVVSRDTQSLEELYAGGATWEVFRAAIDARRELWLRNWESAEVDPGLAERARAAGGPWRILVITEPGCSDSANTVPYIAKLVEALGSLELRLTDSTLGRPWMEAHRTPDDRAATPTVLVLDEAYRVRGCWVEQPSELQAFWLDVVARGAMAAELDRKMTWYEDDAGRSTLRELVEVLERAQAGEPGCSRSVRRAFRPS